MKEKNGISRRDFLSYSALGLASLTILPSWANSNGVKVAPSDRVVLGFIGLGQQALNDFGGFAGCDGVQVAACCDVDTNKTERFRRRIAQWQSQKGMNERCDKYENYEDLLERKDIDAVEVASPDHWHALQAIHACQAGKDVYCQKPLTYTITEAYAVEAAVRRNKRVFQVGSQQRSSGEFQKAIELIQAGKIGHVEKIYSKVGDPPRPIEKMYEEFGGVQKIPANLNFNLWLGPLNDPKIEYNDQLCPPITLEESTVKNGKTVVTVAEKREAFWGAWRWYRETGNGYTADWGAHMHDIANAAMGYDGLQPVEYFPRGTWGEGEAYSAKYPNGTILMEHAYLTKDMDGEDNPNAQGLKFIGTKGWINVARGYLECSDNSLVPENLRGNKPRMMTAEERARMFEEYAKRAAQAERGGQRQAARNFETSSPHMQNFIDCVRSRQNPIAPVEAGTSSAVFCCLCNIAYELGRPVKWNPATRSFVDDKEAAAHRLYYYEYRHPYELPYLDKRC
ncbi:MAG: Gfo/Idh/MocA family oxidoreductase [Bacteroidales bacterium]|jgi:predicted dehydrogenase|nr:Gfo/Idh/MocA family oxidoreductase [Bacteroidales bacterium]